MIEEGKQDLSKEVGPAKVIEFKPRKVFEYSDINDLLPIIYRITNQYSEKVNKLIKKLENIPRHESIVIKTEAEINDLIQEWQIKIEKLGAVTKGLWIADFDSGDGYYCWKFPEEQILYWHGYRDGFSGRRPVKEYLESKTENSKALKDKQVSKDENRNSPNQHSLSEL